MYYEQKASLKTYLDNIIDNSRRLNKFLIPTETSLLGTNALHFNLITAQSYCSLYLNPLRVCFCNLAHWSLRT